ASFNVVRDSATQAAEWAQNVTTIAISQGRLRQDVTSLVSRMRARGLVSADSLMAVITVELDSALVPMQQAEEQLGTQRPRPALPAEQSALRHLQRAEAVYREIQVAMGNQAGGAGQGRPQNAEELADLFELETDKLRNQYESVQRENGQQAERQLDETLE